MNFIKETEGKSLPRTEVMPSLFFLDDVTFDRPSENVEFSHYFSY